MSVSMSSGVMRCRPERGTHWWSYRGAPLRKGAWVAHHQFSSEIQKGRWDSILPSVCNVAVFPESCWVCCWMSHSMCCWVCCWVCCWPSKCRCCVVGRRPAQIHCSTSPPDRGCCPSSSGCRRNCCFCPRSCDSDSRCAGSRSGARARKASASARPCARVHLRAILLETTSLVSSHSKGGASICFLVKHIRFVFENAPNNINSSNCSCCICDRRSSDKDLCLHGDGVFERIALSRLTP